MTSERTLCPHCGRETRTADDGVCVECWGNKSERTVYAAGHRPARPLPQPSKRGDGFLDDALGCLWPVLVVGAATAAATRYRSR